MGTYHLFIQPAHYLSLGAHSRLLHIILFFFYDYVDVVVRKQQPEICQHHSLKKIRFYERIINVFANVQGSSFHIILKMSRV